MNHVINTFTIFQYTVGRLAMKTVSIIITASRAQMIWSDITFCDKKHEER